MTEQALSELLSYAADRVVPSPAPVTSVLSRTKQKRRQQAVARASVLVLATLGILAGAAVLALPRDSAPVPQGPGPTQTEPTQVPPRPAPITMEQVRRFGAAQEFRAYSGPRPPRISEAGALKHAKEGSYSLGLWDVGLVHEDPSEPVEWHSVWILADVHFVQDLNRLSLGGPFGGPTPEPRPGWARSVTMIDASTGEFVIGYSF